MLMEENCLRKSVFVGEGVGVISHFRHYVLVIGSGLTENGNLRGVGGLAISGEANVDEKSGLKEGVSLLIKDVVGHTRRLYAAFPDTGDSHRNVLFADDNFGRIVLASEEGEDKVVENVNGEKIDAFLVTEEKDKNGDADIQDV